MFKPTSAWAGQSRYKGGRCSHRKFSCGSREGSPAQQSLIASKTQCHLLSWQPDDSFYATSSNAVTCEGRTIAKSRLSNRRDAETLSDCNHGYIDQTEAKIDMLADESNSTDLVISELINNTKLTYDHRIKKSSLCCANDVVFELPRCLSDNG